MDIYINPENSVITEKVTAKYENYYYLQTETGLLVGWKWIDKSTLKWIKGDIITPIGTGEIIRQFSHDKNPWPLEVGKEFIENIHTTQTVTTILGDTEEKSWVKNYKIKVVGWEKKSYEISFTTRGTPHMYSWNLWCFRLEHYNENGALAETEWYSPEIRRTVLITDNTGRRTWALLYNSDSLNPNESICVPG